MAMLRMSEFCSDVNGLAGAENLKFLGYTANYWDSIPLQRLFTRIYPNADP
jgi:hypothetical protein